MEQSTALSKGYADKLQALRDALIKGEQSGTVDDYSLQGIIEELDALPNQD